MLLNKDSFPTVYKDHIEYYDYSKIWFLKNYNDFNYYFISVQAEVDLLSVIPNDILSEIIKGNIFLLASCCNEAHTFIVKQLYDTDIPPENIILFSENKNVVTEVYNIFKDNKPKVYWSLTFELGIKFQLYLNRFNFQNVNTLTKKVYTKKFLNFNRRWRLHRPAVVALLYAYQLLDKGYISLASVTDDNLNWNTVYDSILKVLDDDLSLLLKQNKSEIIKLPDLYLDTNNLSVNRPRLVEDDISFEQTRELYENTYFSLISETYFFDNQTMFFTEKTFKPIAFKHPFILITGPNHLSELRGLGYRTFHPFINEDYDREQDDSKRLKLILDEVNRLSNLNEDELFEFIDNVKPIVDHNFKVLFTKPNYGHLHKLIG